MCVLSLQQVSFAYRTRYQTVYAVKEVSCALEAGALYALVGKSGSGKTTLLSLLAGLEKPDTGKILFHGKDLRTMDMDVYRRVHASVIYQNFNLFPFMTVLENVMYPMILNKKAKEQAQTRAQETLEQLGLGANYWRRMPAMLSGGEQQRVAIARAIANDAKLILADEPTGNLDTENTRNIVALLKEMAHEHGCTVVVVTHDEDVANEADYVYRMDSGRLVVDEK